MRKLPILKKVDPLARDAWQAIMMFDLQGLRNLKGKFDPDGIIDLATGYNCLQRISYVGVVQEPHVIAAILVDELGADPNFQDREGNTALHLAARVTDNLRLLEYLIPKSGMDIPNNLGETPAYMSAKVGTLENTVILGRHGAKMEVADKAGTTLLDLLQKVFQDEGYAAYEAILLEQDAAELFRKTEVIKKDDDTKVIIVNGQEINVEPPQNRRRRI